MQRVASALPISLPTNVHMYKAWVCACYPSIYPSIRLSIYPSIYLSIYLNRQGTAKLAQGHRLLWIHGINDMQAFHANQPLSSECDHGQILLPELDSLATHCEGSEMPAGEWWLNHKVLSNVFADVPATHCSHQCCWPADVLHIERYPSVFEAARAQLLRLESVKRMLVPNAVGQSMLLCDHLTCFPDSFKVPSTWWWVCTNVDTRPPFGIPCTWPGKRQASSSVGWSGNEWPLCWNAVTTICSN